MALDFFACFHRTWLAHCIAIDPLLFVVESGICNAADGRDATAGAVRSRVSVYSI
jgi:hypothetical protein